MRKYSINPDKKIGYTSQIDRFVMPG